MKDWILNFLVEIILKAISDDKIEKLAHTVQSILIPYLHDQKLQLITMLKAKAAKTETDVDDAVYHALDVFLSSFIPNKNDTQCLVAAVKK